MLADLKERLKTILPTNTFVRGVGILAGGSALAQGLGVLVAPILTRLYTPEEFGVFAVYVSILSMISVPSALCYQYAIPLPEKDKDAANLLALCLIIILTFSALILVVVFGWSNEIANMFNTASLASVLWTLPIGFLGIGTYQSLNYWVMRRRAYIRILQTKWRQSLTMVLVQLSFGFLKGGALGLIFGEIVGRVGGTGYLLRKTWKAEKDVLQSVSLDGIKKVAVRYKRFPLLSSWSAILNSVGVQIPVLFLTAYHSPAVVGLYALSTRLLGIPLNLISGAVGQVHMAESARLVTQSPELLLRIFWKTVRTMFMIAFPLVGVLALVAPWLFSFVFGVEWREAGIYLQILCPMFLFDLVANSVGETIGFLERQDLHAKREIARTFFMFLGATIASLFSFPPLMSLVCLSVAGTIGYVIHIGLSWWAIRKFRYQIKEKA
jgi:O-antigen/teichoic acid export membrane protein